MGGQRARVVGSSTHGVVATGPGAREVDAALMLFVQDKDTVKFAAAVSG